VARYFLNQLDMRVVLIMRTLDSGKVNKSLWAMRMKFFSNLILILSIIH